MKTPEQASAIRNEGQPYSRGVEAVPRDGPAVYIVNQQLLDEGLGHCGGWLRLDQPRADVVRRLGEIVGSSGNRQDYVVIDQTGLGEIMVDEDDVTGLLGRTTEADGEDRW